MDRLVNAALSIIAEEGLEAATVQRIVRRAGSSVGSFYARFSGKEDLLLYLAERVWTDARTRWRGAVRARNWDRMSLSEVVEGSVDLLIEADRAYTAYREALGSAPDLHRAYRLFHHEVMEGVAEIVLAHAEEVRHPDPGLAARLGAQAVAGALLERAEGGGHLGDDEELRTELARLYRSYLTSSPEDGGGLDARVDFFDIWG